VASALQEMIEEQVEQKGLPALSIALVDGDDVVWATGFGIQNPETGQAASAETVYRVGSVSKLFTDIAVVQLVERGDLDLDAPIQTYLPDFAPENNTGIDITLRQLMSHRSGLVREPPAGHYFDDSGTSLAATVESLNGTELVYIPEERTKYSNAAIATVGYTLEVTQGEPFTDYVRRAVLEPFGMDGSAFTPEPDIVSNLATAYMWGFDRDPFVAPTFELGMAPAGSMYSTVLDLSKFISAMFNRGQGVNGRVLEPDALERMWRPQYAAEGATNGYGLGFAVSELDGHRRLGHGGAIYGFSTQLGFLPDDGLGVVVVSALDGTNSVTGRIADAALAMMLAVTEGRPLPTLPATPQDIDPETALALEGSFGEGEEALELDERNGRLFMTPARGGATVEVRSAGGDTLIVDSRLAFGARFVPEARGLRQVDGPLLERRPAADAPAPLPQRRRGLIGEYGWDHNVLYILENEGRLNALIEWFFLYPLEEVSRNVYAFPDWGLYHGERLIFSRDPSDNATSVEAASVTFVRRDLGTEAGGTFRITPQRPVPELRREALAATPPAESGSFRPSELVEVISIEPGIQLDVRYASTNNFMSEVFYDEARVFLQQPAAEGVSRAHRALAEYGYGLLLHDGYRPWYVTKMFWDATPESGKIFVANPADGSRHNRGSAIDLTLFDLRTGEPVDMVGTYDEMSPRSFPDYPGGTSQQRWLRELLRRAMEAEGFTVYEAEWWHFDHDDWREYAIQNAVFSEISGG
jgi:CubicO group peptidase (beta-lactamase class C family)/D-alanyl-D-alanine dipeptidase